MLKSRRRGHSTIEYMLFFTAVIIALMIFTLGLPQNTGDIEDPETGALPGAPGPVGANLRDSLNAIYTAGADSVGNTTGSFYNAMLNHAALPGN